MTPVNGDSRRSIYALLLATAAGVTAGNIAAVQRGYEPSAFRAMNSLQPGPNWPADRPAATPTLRSNDRSRWATVRALVEEGTFVIGRRDPKGAKAGDSYID